MSELLSLAIGLLLTVLSVLAWLANGGHLPVIRQEATA